MACFLVSAAEAVVVTAIEKAEEKKELKMAETETEITEEVTIPWSRKLKWLTYMLWGGAVLLAFEHIWHGEVVPWFPFLTAISHIDADSRYLVTSINGFLFLQTHS